MSPDFSWIQRMMERTEMMEEVFPGESIIEVVGEGRVLIEGHKGVSAYGGDRVCVKIRSGIAEICGSNLKLTRMNVNKLVITGSLDSVNLLRRLTE